MSEHRTKEEILRDSLHYDSEVPDHKFKSEFAIELAAMDEYAQQESIAFAEWCVAGGWYMSNATANGMKIFYWTNESNANAATTDQLYNLYLQSKK